MVSIKKLCWDKQSGQESFRNRKNNAKRFQSYGKKSCLTCCEDFENDPFALIILNRLIQTDKGFIHLYSAVLTKP